MVGLSDIDTNNYAKVLDYKKSLSRDPVLQRKAISGEPIQTPNSQERIVNKLHQQQKRLSDEEIDCIISGYQNGQTVYELAEQYGCHRMTISNKLKVAGVTIRRLPPSNNQIDKMVELYRSGLSLENVGKRVGTAAKTVLKYLKQRDVETRDTHGYAK
ncbi:MAG: helix-turn-helix domain-containing protein [Christensenellales bacterium]